jgi:RNA polymerase sigma-70 factor (ECF subfamily)
MKNIDQKLVNNIISGDREAFDSFYNTYFQKVYNYIYMQIREHTATEDLTQEAFMACFESIEQFQGKSSLLCWVFGITKNTVRNWFRKKSREIHCQQIPEEIFLENLYIDRSSPLSDLEYQEFLTNCNKKFNQLSPDRQEIFLKKHFQGMSLNEIALETQKTVGAVKTELYRAKLSLLND